VSGLRNAWRKGREEDGGGGKGETVQGKSSLVYPASAHPRGHRLAAVVTHEATKAAGACHPIQREARRERERGGDRADCISA